MKNELELDYDRIMGPGAYRRRMREARWIGIKTGTIVGGIGGTVYVLTVLAIKALT